MFNYPEDSELNQSPRQGKWTIPLNAWPRTPLVTSRMYALQLETLDFRLGFTYLVSVLQPKHQEVSLCWSGKVYKSIIVVSQGF